MTEVLKIGMGQLLVEGGEPERNLKRAGKMLEDAAEKSCRLVLLPECLDFAWTHPSAKTEAQPIPGPYSDILCKLAKTYNLYLCAGLTERSEDKVYNTAIFISPEGNILLKYRKINVLTVAQDIYSIGETLSVVKTPFGVVGVNICSDNYIDSLDIGHTLARMGAQIILSPSSWTVDYSIVEGDILYGKKWLKPYQTLAVAHDLIVVSATAVGVIVGGVYEGKKMVGCSLAVNKDGIVAEGKYNEFTGQLVIADITIPPPRVLGTAIGESLKMRGLYH
tara:strand:- start:690 stop:1523 length:834 start_codon:yes stop_codon:yes gene_type:complete